MKAVIQIRVCTNGSLMMVSFLNLKKIILLSLLPIICIGQKTSSIDSLNALLPNQNGVERAQTLVLLNDEYKYSDPVKSLELSNEIYSIGQNLKLDSIKLKGILGKSFAFLYQYKLDSSFKYSTLAKRLALEIEDTNQLQRSYELLTHYFRYVGPLDSALHYSEAIIKMGKKGFLPYFNLGAVYREMGNLSQSLKYLNLAREEAILSENPNYIAGVYNVLSDLYKEIGDEKSAEKNAVRFLEAATEANHKQGILTALVSLSKMEEVDADKRAGYIQQGIELSQELNQPAYTYQFKWFMARLELKKGDVQLALDSLLSLYDQTGNARDVTHGFIAETIAQCYLKLGDLDQAEKFALISMEARQNKNKKRRSNELSTMMDIYSHQKNYTAYHDLAKEYITITDSVNKENQLKRLAFFQSQMEDVEQQKAIVELNQNLLVEKTRKNRLVLGGAILAGLLLLIIYFRNREVRIQKKTAVELGKVNTKLKELDELKGRFYANVSHELRTPLSLIKGPVSNLLASHALDEKERRMVSMIQRNSKKLEKRINEILDLAKLDAAKLTVEEKSTELVSFSKRMLAFFESMAEQKDIKTQFESTESEILGLVDTKKVEMILHNFISNAIKFTAPGGLIKMTITRENGSLLWCVTDDGRGIEQDQIEKVFERFYQNPHSKTIEGGTGIGLALSRELSAVMSGKVWAESELGKGSRFYLNIPYKEGERDAQPDQEMEESLSSPALPESSQAGSGNILLVEDNADLREYILSILPEHNVRLATNGIEALEILREHTPDLILSDIMMPQMDGYELVERIKMDEKLQSIPVIMLTARASHEDKMRALRIGVDDYLLKPFNQEELKARIGNALNRLRSRENTNDDVQKEIVHHGQNWLQELETVLLEHISQSHFTLEMAAEHMNISKRQMQRRIKKYTGLTASEYVRELRLNQAREWLESGKFETVAEVAYAVGFEHTNYFSGIYQDRFGKKPIDYLN